MRMDEYLRTVTEQVRCSRMHDSIAEELKDHILDQVGVIEILMLEPLGGQFGIGLPAVGVGFDHPGVADVGENDDLVFDVQGQNPH